MNAHKSVSKLQSFHRPTTEEIIRYENGEMETEEEVVAFFQKLVNSGLVWHLQGHYQRTADMLIREGLVNYEPSK